MFTTNKAITTVLLIFILFSATISVYAETLSFDNVLDKSIHNSFDLKISDINVDLSKSDLKITRSEYYPRIQLHYNNEYENNLGPRNAQFASVGSTFISSSTRFQNLIYFDFRYNLLDFGIRRKKMLIAINDIEQKELVYNQTLRDLKIDLIKLYTDALLSYKDIKLYENTLPIYKELFSIKEKLYTAGTSPKLELMEEAINIARTQDRIDSSKAALKTVLKDLSSYTFEEYDVEKIKLENFKKFEQEEHEITDFNINPIFKQSIEKKIISLPQIKNNRTLEKKIYDLEITKKKLELETLKRERFPKFEFYTNYMFYGSDENNPLESFSDVRSRNVSVGISALLPIFDGFKNSASREKIALEIQKLELEKQKELNRINTEYNKLYGEAFSRIAELNNKEDLLFNVKEKLSALKRMTNAKLTEESTVLNQKAELLNQASDLEKSIIKTLSLIKQLEILSEEY
ncbi:MAG: TolC family protein [Cyanobacteriota bacterium]